MHDPLRWSRLLRNHGYGERHVKVPASDSMTCGSCRFLYIWCQRRHSLNAGRDLARHDTVELATEHAPERRPTGAEHA